MQEIAKNQNGSVRVLFVDGPEKIEGNDLPLTRRGFWLQTPYRHRFLGEHRPNNWIKALT